MRSILPLLFCLSSLVAAPAHAQQFFIWRDANGVRHYSDSPPPHNKYAERTIRERRKPEATAPNAIPASTHPACTRARANIAVFANNDTVRMDRNNDGVAELLNDAERAAELNRATTAARISCVSQ